ncbi:MAG: glycosyltransferase family 4 protein [Dehalococcoidales bacterium]|nr:glycosyltransferase family 4 protein [Dehalococcoidales bacterium]
MINKVVLITSYWKKSCGGGAKTYLVELAGALQEKVTGLTVLFEEGEDPGNYKIGSPRFLFPFKALWVLCKIKPQIVHTHGPWYCLMAGFLYRMFFRCRLVHTFHSAPDESLPVFGRVFMQCLVNRCDCVTFVSAALQTQIEQVYELRFKQTAVTYAGVKPVAVTGAEIHEFRSRFKIPESSIVLLAQSFTANKLKAEGLKLLIGVLQRLLPELPDLLLVVTRQGVFSSQLMRYVKEKKLEEHVIFTGDVENSFVPVAIADIYTHITLSDGLPLAILEAMALEKPVIATNIGGIAEAIDHMKNGIITEPVEDRILEAVKLLIGDGKLAQKLARNARMTVERRFNWDKTSHQLLRIYEGVN